MNPNWLNLFPFKVEWNNLKFFKYSVSIPNFDERRKALNRLRYRIFYKNSAPVFYKETEGEVYFYSFKPLEVRTFKLSEKENYQLSLIGEEKVPRFETRCVEFVIEDIIRLKNLFVNFSKRFEKVVEHPKYGKLELFPSPFVRVYYFKEFLLQVDFKFHLLPQKDIQQLFEEKLLRPEDVVGNSDFLVRPKASISERSAYITELVKAKDLKEETIEQLFNISLHPQTKKLWEKILKDKALRERIFVATLSNGYVYPAPLLRPVLTFVNLEDISAKILKNVKLPPWDRWKLIVEFVKTLKPNLEEFKIFLNPQAVKVNDKIDYHRTVIDAENKTFEVKKSILPFLQDCKPFVKKPILRTTVVALYENNSEFAKLQPRLSGFLRSLKEFLEEKGIKLQKVKTLGFEASSNGQAMEKLSENMSQILKGNPDLYIVFLPRYGDTRDLYKELSTYDYLKSKFLEKGIASQFILNETLFLQNLDYVVYNVAEQIMGKTANVPYKLSENLKDADVFIGIDISRARKDRGGSINEGAFTKIFFSDGTFLKYSLSSFPAMGEEVTRKAIQSLFLRLREEGILEGSTVVIHRDGTFRGNEIEIFNELGKRFGYNLELVEVIKGNNPRFFGKNFLIKGLYYPLGERGAVVATYDNTPHYTHQPLRIRLVKGNLPLERHISYLLSFTLLNYSSFKPVKLPATTYHTDRMAKMALRGLKPLKSEGEEMFWL